MIRMGKSSKDEETTTSPGVNESISNPASNMTAETQTSNAFSESELMARDIKEGRLSGFVGGGTVLTGDTEFDAMLRVDGHLKGSVSSKDGTLLIGSTGQVDADIDVAIAEINGAVNGDITTSERLTLGRTAQVVGNIQAPRLIIEDGALLEGSCRMIELKETIEAKVAERREELATAEIEEEEEAETETDETSSYPTEIELSSDEDSDDDEYEEVADAATAD